MLKFKKNVSSVSAIRQFKMLRVLSRLRKCKTITFPYCPITKSNKKFCNKNGDDENKKNYIKKIPDSLKRDVVKKQTEIKAKHIADSVRDKDFKAGENEYFYRKSIEQLRRIKEKREKQRAGHLDDEENT